MHKEVNSPSSIRSRNFSLCPLDFFYFVGFLVVAGHLSKYGVASFSVLQLQYLIAGFWCIGLPVGFALVLFTARKFEKRAASRFRGTFTAQTTAPRHPWQGCGSGVRSCS